MLDETPAQMSARLTADSAAMRRETPAQTNERRDRERREWEARRESEARAAVRKTEGEWRDDLGHRLRGYGSVQTGPPPDPYASGRSRRVAPCPTNDPHYDPHGQPPDGYALALRERNRR